MTRTDSLRRWLAALPLLLGACASPPAPDAGMAVTLPVEDPRTPHVTATLYRPASAAPVPAVVLLSGCFGVRHDAALLDDVVRRHRARGIATLVVDSLGPRGLDEVCSDAKLNVDSVTWRVRDIYAAVDWLAALPGIDGRRIFLQGYSHGAQAAIGAIDGQWPRARFPAVAGVVAFTPYCLAKSRFTVPTLVLAAELDDWAPAPLCTALAGAPNLQVHVYPGARHGFAVPGRDVVFQGHRLQHDPAATADAHARALAFVLEPR